MEANTYISRLEEENEELREKVSELSQEVDTLKLEAQLHARDLNESGNKYILSGKNKIFVNDLSHMWPVGKFAQNYMSKPSVQLLICKNCLTCGVNHIDNMFIRKIDNQGKDRDFCRHCRTEDSFYYVAGYWYTTTKIVQRVVKKKRWFTGKIYDDLEQEKVKIGKWKFVHERS